MLEPGLYLVATPLGHLGDLSQRARETLSRASFVAGESSKMVLRWMEILELPKSRRPGLLTYRESSRERDAEQILDKLRQGDSVALISDAGTPVVSDPGWELVASVRRQQIPIWSVPGPCAAIAALTLAGFPSRRFVFEGFLASGGKKRREALSRLAACPEPVLLYESPHRFLSTLQDLASSVSQRELFVVREMTKKFEEQWRGPSVHAADYWKERTIKGEFTLVVGPGETESSADQVPEETLAFLRSLELPTKVATAVVKHFFPEADKKAIYRCLQRKP